MRAHQASGLNPAALSLSAERARRYDHLAHIPEGTAALATQDILQQLNNISCGGRCAVGSGGKSVGARAAPGAAAVGVQRCSAWAWASVLRSVAARRELSGRAQSAKGCARTPANMSKAC